MCRQFYCPCDSNNQVAFDVYGSVNEKIANAQWRTISGVSKKYEQIYFHSDESIKLYNDYETCYNDI
jgi:hypothetical protein